MYPSNLIHLTNIVSKETNISPVSREKSLYVYFLSKHMVMHDAEIRLQKTNSIAEGPLQSSRGRTYTIRSTSTAKTVNHLHISPQ